MPAFARGDIVCFLDPSTHPPYVVLGVRGDAVAFERLDRVAGGIALTSFFRRVELPTARETQAAARILDTLDRETYFRSAAPPHDHAHPNEVTMPGVIDAITQADGYRIVHVGGSRVEIPDALEVGPDIIEVGALVDVILRRA